MKSRKTWWDFWRPLRRALKKLDDMGIVGVGGETSGGRWRRFARRIVFLGLEGFCKLLYQKTNNDNSNSKSSISSSNSSISGSSSSSSDINYHHLQ